MYRVGSERNAHRHAEPRLLERALQRVDDEPVELRPEGDASPAPCLARGETAQSAGMRRIGEIFEDADTRADIAGVHAQRGCARNVEQARLGMTVRMPF